MDEALRRAADALAAVEGLEVLPCDGEGHPIPDAVACVHVRCTLPSPDREQLLARVAPVVRRAQFVMAALVDRRDLYSVSWKPPRRGAELENAVDKLVSLLGDADSLDSGVVPDRRGR